MDSSQFYLLKSHILGYDGVWYSSFWSELSRNHLNWQNLVQNFVPGISTNGALSPAPRRCKSKPQGTKFCQFRWFLGLSDQNELYRTPSYPKIWDFTKKEKNCELSLYITNSYETIASNKYKQGGLAVSLRSISRWRWESSATSHSSSHWEDSQAEPGGWECPRRCPGQSHWEFPI